LRDERLDETLFSSLAQARAAITAWKEDSNRNRPHSSLDNITPELNPKFLTAPKASISAAGDF